MKDEFYFPSKDGNTEIHTIEWKPEGQVKAVLQLSHGMVEYVDRYSEFAEYLCEKGFYVVGNDHLGHGKSVQSKSEYGFLMKIWKCMCSWRFTYIETADDEKIPGRALFYAWTQHGIVSAETIYSDVWQWTQWSDHHGDHVRAE